MEFLRNGDPGQVGRYRLLGRLGGGGMGQVFLGETPGGLKVAVKVIRPEYADDPDFRLRFAREVEAARRVGGLHTPLVVDAAPDADPPWMVTSFIPGPSLASAVAENGPLDLSSLRKLGAALAEGLAVIHACGLVHRDLKPDNIILAIDGPRIIDFGIAKSANVTTITTAGVAIGTLRYMSPEQVQGETGPASDVFSLGAVLTFAVTGHGPFDAPDQAVVLTRILTQAPDLGELSGSLRDVISTCLDKNPGARPTLADLLTYFTGGGSPAPEEPGPVREATLPAVFETPEPLPLRQPSLSTADTWQGPAWAGTGTRSRQALFGPAGPVLEHSGTVDLVSFSPDGRFLVGGADDLTLRIWDTSTWRPACEPLSADVPKSEHRRAFRQVLFTRSGSLLATVSNEPGVWQWQVASLGSVGGPSLLPGSLGQGPPRLSPDGRHSVTNHETNLILTDTAKGSHQVLNTEFFVSGYSWVPAMFSPDSSLLSVLDDAGQIHLWRADTRKRVGVLRGPLVLGASRMLMVQQVSISSDNRFIVARAATRKGGVDLHRWDRHAEDSSRPRLVAADVGEESDFAFSPDGGSLAFIHHHYGRAGREFLRLWDAETRRVFDLQGHPKDAWGLAFSPNGRRLVAASRRELFLWDTVNQQPIEIQHHSGHLDKIIRDITFSPDGRLLATAEGKTVQVRLIP